MGIVTDRPAHGHRSASRAELHEETSRPTGRDIATANRTDTQLAIAEPERAPAAIDERSRQTTIDRNRIGPITGLVHNRINRLKDHNSPVTDC